MITSLIVAVLISTTTQVFAQTSPRVTGQLFANEVLADNARKVSQQTSELPPQEQFEALRKWVLPSASNAGFRFDGWFDEHYDEQTSLNLKSPVIKLVELARKLNRLNELRESAVNCEVNNTYDERCQAALLAIVEVADGNVAAAMAHTEVLDRIIRDEQPPPDAWPEYTLATLAVETPELREFAIDALHSLNDWKRDRFRFNSRLYSLRNRIEYEFHRAKFPGPEWNTSGKPPKNWYQTTAIGAEELGTNLPGSFIAFEKDHLQTWSTGGSDVVFYQSPLSGDYAVECEIQTSSKSLLSVGGYAFGFGGGTTTFREGDFWRTNHGTKVEPAFSKLDPQYVARAEVSGGMLTAYLNGRAVHTRQLAPGDAPWAAIQNIPGRHGVVRNIRITGDPVVPDEISMIGPRSFEGAWSKHLHYGVNWYVTRSTTGTSLLSTLLGTAEKRQPAELRCDKWMDVVGTGVESLLYYQRPMVEDGAIEFEFFHSDDTRVHPALGQTAFVLLPDGVRIHEVTNGSYETRRLPCLNLQAADASSQLSTTLPLKSDEWNRLKFELQQDTLTLSLNATPIYCHAVRQSKDQRHFGLFHIADRTGARVRNMTWKGDWPKSVPAIDQQPFADPPHELLRDTSRLSESFTHDFGTQGPGNNVFTSSGSKNVPMVQTNKGINVSVTEGGNWKGFNLQFVKPLSGDFDAILEYADFHGTGQAGRFSIELMANDPSGLECGISRRRADERHSVAAKLIILAADGKKQYQFRHASNESSAGRLRLLRQGAEVHTFFAENRSDNFQFVETFQLPSEFSEIQLELSASAQKESSGSVSLTRLTVRTDPNQTHDVDMRIVALEQHLRREAPDKQQVLRFREVPELLNVSSKLQTSVVNHGLQISTSDSEQSVSLQRTLLGDFDVDFVFDGKQMSDGTFTRLVAQIGNQNVAVVARRVGESGFEISVTGDGRENSYGVVPVTAETVRSLRLIRVQASLFAVYTSNRGQAVLAQIDVDRAPVDSGGLQFQLAPPQGEASSVVLKKVTVRAAMLGD